MNTKDKIESLCVARMGYVCPLYVRDKLNAYNAAKHADTARRNIPSLANDPNWIDADTLLDNELRDTETRGRA